MRPFVLGSMHSSPGRARAYHSSEWGDCSCMYATDDAERTVAGKGFVIWTLIGTDGDESLGACEEQTANGCICDEGLIETGFGIWKCNRCLG